jgi:hypothetical protein
MAEQISFPSIEPFYKIIKYVRDRADYHGISGSLPTLKFHGTVKLHGTNAAIVRSPSGELWAQSRTGVITPENDNAGFARFVMENEAAVNVLLDSVVSIDARFGDATIAVYGEWCGGNIQKGVALNQLPKQFVVFGVRVLGFSAFNFDNTEERWLTPQELKEFYEVFSKHAGDSSKIKCIESYQTWDLEIDFANPAEAQNKLVELTMVVEAECPFGKAHGVSGVGEGIVWRCVSDWIHGDWKITTQGFTFKTKGEKHSDTKVKKIVSVDVEKVNSINEFVNNVLTDHRLEKMLDLLRQGGFDVDVKNTGEFLKLVGQDIVKEESDVMDASGLDRKEVMSPLNRQARAWFLEKATAV